MWTQTQPNGKVRYFERGKDGKVVSVTMPDTRKSTRKEAVYILNRKLS